MKRIVSLVLILTMLTGMLPMRAFATEDTSETQIIEATVATEATAEPTETEDTETTEEPAEAESTETTAPAEDAEDPILAENTEISQVWALPRKSNVDCIWDFDQDLYARSADGEIQNALQSQALKGNYTLADGYLNAIDLQMALENTIELEADKNWSVEWKYGALNGGLAGFLLCELPGNALGNKGIWHMNNGQIAIADYQDSKGYRNYTSSAVTIKDYDCVRMRNRYDEASGKSTISLWINDELAISDFQLKGCMNDYHDREDMTGHPLNADFAFAYLGNTGMADWDVNCQLDYLKITFNETISVSTESMSMQYDDHLDVTGKTVEILDGVVTQDGNYLVAADVGNATVRIDDTIYKITVEKAKLNLIMIMGQSNAGNHFTNAISDVTCPVGTAYWWGNGLGTSATEPVPYTQPSLGFHTPLLAELYAQSFAAGDPVKNVLIWEEGITSKNGQSIVKWAASAQDTSGTDGAVEMLNDCRAYYEARSDKYEIVSSGIYWLQGESDTEKDALWYTQRFMAMWQRLKNAGMEYVAFLRVRRASSVNTATRDDLYYSGSLSAQIKMINENPEFYMATTVTENWIGTVETSHDVDISRYITMMETYGQKASYSDSHGNSATYANGILTTTMKELYGSNNTCHYGKFGYGIIGADAAYNMYKAMHTPNTAIEVTVTSGHADKQYVLTNGQEVTLDASAMTDNLSFRAAAGSAAGTLKFTIKSGANDITVKSDLVITSGEQYGAVNVQNLQDYEDVAIEITYSTTNGKSYTAVCNIKTAPKSPAPSAPPKTDYTWDFNSDLYARSADGEIQNSLLNQVLKGSYTLENGYLTGKDLQMALENTIELEADKNWSVEWKYGALNGGLAGFLLCELPGNALGNKGIWHMNNGQIAIADYQDSKGYRNYTSSAVEIKDYDCLRMTNQYNSDTGRSIISLWINDMLVISDFQLKGSMNDYHDKNDMTGYPLSADFAFAYLGNTGASDWYVNCQLDYLKISFGEAEHNHQYTATVTEPTTTAPGFTTYTCSCGDSYVDDYVDAAGKYKRLEALMERGSVSTTYDLGYTSNHYKNYVRSAFDIKTGGAARMSVENRAVTHGEMYVQFFASDYTKISSVKYTNQSVINIPDACDFIRVEIATSQELEKIVIRFYDGTDEPREAKRSGINEVSEKLTYKVSDELHTTSRLMLPPNYSIDGEKVPLILWLEGSGSSFSSWYGDFNSNKLPYLRYLADEGFAVFSVYAWGNQYAEKYPNCGNSFPYPIPTNLACIKEGIAYICDRYNIDADNIHIMSKSQGGQCALYYASCNELNVKTIGMFAPVLDYLSMPGEAMYKDTRAAIADDLDFTGDVAYFASDRFLSYSDEGRAFLRGNLTQLLILNEAWTNLSGAAPEELFESAMDDCETFWTEQIWKTDRTDIYTHTDYVKTASVPVKIWGAKDDAATPYLKMVEVVQQLKNGGSVAELVTLPNSTGGHSCADIGSTRVNVTTALGIEHKNVPIGWVENVQWIRSNGAADDAHVHTHTPVITAPTCTEQGYTTYTCECGDSYVDDYVDATGHKRTNGSCTVCGDSFAGKKVSILSASTSTYVGVSNNTSYNSTIGKNDVYYTEGRHGVYQKDMWWQQVIDVLDMELLVNNAWSGSCIFQPRKGAASVGYGNRAVNLHNDHTGEEPDIVWVYLGSNDFAYYQDTFGKAAEVDYSALIKDNGDGTFDYAAPTTTCEAYAIMLHKIENRYPGVKIYCMPALARRDPDYAEDNRPDPGQPTAFNAELIAVAEHSGCTVINWENCIPKEAEFFDQYIGDKRAHPNAAGMDLMSQAVISGMLGKETELYDIAGTYTNVYTDNNAAAAMEGGDYQATLTADHGSTLDVTVTMGGTDVTQSVYSNGTIYIENITGDIKITAVAYRAPQEFCWEVVDGTLASTGKNENTLTVLAESISDGVIQEGRYQLETPVMLKHNQPWVMEWKCAGDWRGILLSTTASSGTDGRQYLARTKGGQLCFGIRSGSQSNNYGVDLSKLDAQPHTYRLENRIAADGSNMVWLYLDGIEVGPMNNYFLASKDQGTTSDWINGKDFVFPYIGMDTTPVTNCQLDYLSVTECAHTYENGVCTGCGAKLGDLDLSGDINSDDLTLLACHVARIATLEGQALSNADVNGDGQVNADDLTRHAQYVARIITSWDQA